MSALVAASREELLFALSLLVLLAGTGLWLLALRVPRLDALACSVAAAGAAAWLLSNSRHEGPTLLEVLPGNGFTAADVAAVPAGLAVAALCWRWLSARSR